ncbi:MAG TPA: ABC transporter permease [Anaerolineaceae bacterium]|nr:ABC transporter permease [Anaerolineaceae bacterium]
MNLPALVALLLKDLVHDASRSLLTFFNLATVILTFFLLAALSQAIASFGRQPPRTNLLLLMNCQAIDPMQSYLTEADLEPLQQLGPAVVQRVFPVLFYHLRIHSEIVQVRAVPREEITTAFNLTLLEGAFPAEGQIAVSEGARVTYGWKTGDRLPVYGSEFPISGVVRAPGTKFISVWMPLETARDLFESPDHFQIGAAVLAPGADPQAARAILEADPRVNTRNSVFFESNLTDRYAQGMGDPARANQLLALASLLAVTFGVYNTIRLSLEERGLELALLRVVGFTPGQVAGFLAARTALLTAAAYAAGWICAAFLLDWFQATTSIILYGVSMPLEISPLVGAGGAILTLCFALVGVWLSTRHLSARPVAAVLREERA